jgi:hypothetical protein
VRQKFAIKIRANCAKNYITIFGPESMPGPLILSIGSIAFYNQDLNFYLEKGGEFSYNKSMERKRFPVSSLNFLGLKMTAKAVNYTPEQTAQVVADYTAGVTVETIAQNLGKSVRSVVAKLSREKVYVAKVYVGKNGEKPVRKDAHADAIGAVLRLTEAETESLTKANKTALEKIFQALANSQPMA